MWVLFSLGLQQIKLLRISVFSSLQEPMFLFLLGEFLLFVEIVIIYPQAMYASHPWQNLTWSDLLILAILMKIL